MLRKYYIEIRHTHYFLLKILLCLGMLITTSCMGPLLSHDTGRTLGAGENQFQFVAAQGNYRGLSYSRGVTENLDLGIKMETLTMGISGKYALLDKENDAALAIVGGLGSTFGGKYYLAGLAASYRLAKWEPFASIRTTKVSVDQTEVMDADTGDVFAIIPGFDYSYSQAFVGCKYRFNKNWGLSMEAASFIADNGVKFENSSYYSLAAEIYF